MYATPDNMRATFDELQLVQLAGADDWAGAQAKINSALQRATVIADGFVSKYYAAAPGTPVPELLANIVCDIAYCDMHKQPTDTAKDRKAEAMALLDKISRGLVKLDSGDVQALAPREGAVIVPDRERTFSRDTLGGF